MCILLPSNNQISAILPAYTPTGDQTLLYTADREQRVLNLKTSTVIRRLAIRHSIDLGCLKANMSQLTKSIKWQPLVLAPDLLLVPLKVRKPKLSGDSTIGYFNFYQINTVSAANGATLLLLKNDHKFAVLWQRQTVEEHLQRAHLAALAHKQTLVVPENLLQYLLGSSLDRRDAPLRCSLP